MSSKLIFNGILRLLEFKKAPKQIKNFLLDFEDSFLLKVVLGGGLVCSCVMFLLCLICFPLLIQCLA